jgi:uncharacterized protein YkvS
MNALEALTAIHKMSSSELNLVVEAVKLRRTALAKTAARKITRGDRVRFTGRGGATVRGCVEKVNPKTVVVDAGVDGKWKVTASMLTVVE